MKAKYGYLTACALACAAALAQEPARNTSSGTAYDSTPAVDAAVQLAPKTENGITYLCGGIGSTEAAQMKRDAGNYHLMLTFAENTGAYLAAVDVSIADTRGNELLRTSCDAPIMLVNFPKAGGYRVRAEVDGHPVNRLVRVGRRGHSSVAMVWPRRLLERPPTVNLQGSVTP
ncbi:MULTISPECIES: hypothetical protein [unclassified Janthinobacterium]|uniref:hypothetical protein n=1 Tax=unclassified Janthinobacterium TaxID=2610881 RepID=UPI000345BA8F|nr:MULTISPECIES: hypothetical protein [unclassified Janthinobacterium]MEC5160484.1 hypothetical protein [Janthinobacterium sp. CG_S6]